MSELGLRYTRFNGNIRNGSWQLRSNSLALYFGRDTISGPADLKWLVFQQVPGSRLWISVKDPDAHEYTCVMTETLKDFAMVRTDMLDFLAEISSVHVREDENPPSTHSPEEFTATEDEPEVETSQAAPIDSVDELEMMVQAEG